MSFAGNPPVRCNDYFSRLEVDDEDGNEFTDRWNTGELLCLASAVQRSGDKNWVSVSRSIKPFGEPKRPSDWYAPKNCALQYSKLLKGVEDFKKKTLPRTERETSEELLVKSLTDKRLNELTWLNQQTKAVASALKIQMELVDCGEFDEHIDDLLKQIEELEKHDEDDFKEWISKRECLSAAKRLNKCRITLNTKGKAPCRGFESKRKNSPNRDHIEEATPHAMGADMILKTEADTDDDSMAPTKTIYMKQETDAVSGINSVLDNKTPITSSPLPTPVTPTSPLLTSLLRNVPSVTASSQNMSSVNLLSKESDGAELAKSSNVLEMDIGVNEKSRETSPRTSVPQSPRPTPASSPLLNSLLKNSPSSSLSSIHTTQSKETTPVKAVSSPQPFFNPTSALATAAAQQLAVATSLPHFFQEIPDNRKSSVQSSVNSACLSAPTLSKLLEMPPSTPGRLPPLPVIDPPSSTVSSITASPSEPVVVQSLQKSDSNRPHTDVESPSKMVSDKVPTEQSVTLQSSPIQKSTDSSPVVDKKITATILVEETNKALQNQKISKHGSSDFDKLTQEETIDILETVYEKISQTFEKKDMEQSLVDAGQSEINNTDKGPVENVTSVLEEITTQVTSENVDAEDLKSTMIDVPASDSETKAANKVCLVTDEQKESSRLNADTLKVTEQEVKKPAEDPSHESITKLPDASEEERGANSKKFYKSRGTSKKRTSTEEEVLDKDDPAVKHVAKKLKTGKTEANAASVIFPNENLEVFISKDMEESPSKIHESKLHLKPNEVKSPVSKKPRLFDKTLPKEKKALSDEEAPPSKRPGRRAKKGRGKITKTLPVKQEPKDQYEFSESTEENSVGYQTSSTLCYMPRVKGDVHCEESKTKLISSQNSEDASSPTDKKYFSSASKNKHRQNSAPQAQIKKALFTSDEERMSDSVTSDDASNPLLGEDKLKKWKESSDKKDENFKVVNENAKTSQGPSKPTDPTKKKIQQIKKSVFSSKNHNTVKKDKKPSISDVEESSACSRDSEDVANQSGVAKEVGESGEGKDHNVSCVDIEMEASDSRLSSNIATESDKQIDDAEGSESLQGSVTADFSPLPSTTEIKEGKEISTFGKQDWYHGSSPKSCEPISQSSEESEYESDNWDNQSVSTNKSASHSNEQLPRPKRKERESPQFKAWKKAIQIVLREASCHKYANVFLQKVTNDVAPGYLSIVYRPMDLSLIKKNIDGGIIRSTREFQRDMMLMFQNAVLYNSSDHDVHDMAVKMQYDVLNQIHDFVKTQVNNKDEHAEPASSLRGGRTTKLQKAFAK